MQSLVRVDRNPGYDTLVMLERRAIELLLHLAPSFINLPTIFTSIRAIRFTSIPNRRHFWPLVLREARGNSSLTRGVFRWPKPWPKPMV